MARKTEFQRFVEKIRPPKDPVRDCWLWIGKTNSTGYGSFVTAGGRKHSKVVSAHLFSLEMHTLRPKPKGMDADHLCRNRRCVNPLHLEIVSHRENVSRGRLAALKPGKASGFVGVTWHKKNKRWVARARPPGGGEKVSLGCFATEEEARAAYLKFIGGE